jgi:D-serine deaminase-like pyridoxal phosphate-dependent protein
MGEALGSLETPCLVLEKSRLIANIKRLKQRLRPLGVRLRPHMKTAKSIDVARLAMEGAVGPVTVSTLKEAKYFLSHGVSDLLYAVGIAPNKLDHVFDLRRRGANLTIIVDNAETARLVAAKSTERRDPLPVLIEVDSDDHRSGIKPADHALVHVGRALHEGGAALRGVHDPCRQLLRPARPGVVRGDGRTGTLARRGGGQGARGRGIALSRGERGIDADRAFCARPHRGHRGAGGRLHVLRSGDGRHRRLQPEDIALSVLATVIGHQRDKGWIIVDAGWMAMSRDRGTARLAVDQGYGVACDVAGRPIPDLIMIDANQEHGILAARPGSQIKPPELPVGAMVRILPNHACATGAQHDRYRVVDNGPIVSAIWPRIQGW